MILLLPSLLLVILVSLYDFRHARISNWVTLPLIAIGALVQLPQTSYIFLILAAFFFAWQVGWMGGGDAKLWMGIVLIAPATRTILWAIPLTFFGTALLQLLWRRIRGRVVLGRQAPAAWRTVVYLLILVGVHAH